MRSYFARAVSVYSVYPTMHREDQEAVAHLLVVIGCFIMVFTVFKLIRWCCEDKTQCKCKQEQSKLHQDETQVQQPWAPQYDRDLLYNRIPRDFDYNRIPRDFDYNRIAREVRAPEHTFEQSSLRWEEDRLSYFTSEDLALKKRSLVPPVKILSDRFVNPKKFQVQARGPPFEQSSLRYGTTRSSFPEKGFAVKRCAEIPAEKIASFVYPEKFQVRDREPAFEQNSLRYETTRSSVPKKDLAVKKCTEILAQQIALFLKLGILYRELAFTLSSLKHESTRSSFLREDVVKKRTVVPAAKTSSMPKHTLDLHNRHLECAMQALRSFLNKKEEAFIRGGCNRADRFIHIITGQGNHSRVKGVPVIKPKVEDYLKKKEFCYRFVNPGMIQVDLMIKRQYF